MGDRTGRAMRAAGYDHVCGRHGVPFYDRKEDETRKVDTPFGPMEICRRALMRPGPFLSGMCQNGESCIKYLCPKAD